MQITLLLQFYIILPLIAFVLSLVLPRKNENLISAYSFISVGLHMISSWLFIALWIWKGAPLLNIKELVLYKTDTYEFFIDLSFDKVTAVYLVVGSFITFLITIYSRYYMHREQGYKRFFNTVLFFYLGYNIIIFAGNMETLFVGWEVLGISSFLLIAFYRDRYLPVKNAVKVFSVYRIGDVGLIIAMWMSHHLWHENITFVKLQNYELVNEQLQMHSWIGIAISMAILLSAVAKSAQIPFSSWLPRAMEGPTPSSAIFYGSLSVHIGVFLLIRTMPFWEHQLSVRIIIGLIGLVTSLLATGVGRVQSSVKSQIAYSSIAQIGLIFIEVALGFETLALIHFAGNAFLRTYQLLVSPSVVSYLIREQFYNYVPREHTVEDSWPKRIEYSLYILCLKEWNLDAIMYRYLWNPIKLLGRKLDFLTTPRLLTIMTPVVVAGAVLLANRNLLTPMLTHWFSIGFALLGLVMVLKAFTERIHARLAWILVMFNHFMVAIAISFNEAYHYSQMLLYLSGILVAGLIGYFTLRRLKQLEGSIDLDQFRGYSYRHPKLSLLFLLASLGAMGFPITPTFIGEDVIFTHIHEDQYLLATFTALSFVVDGLAIVRIFARVFLGPHVKSIYEMAYRSS